MCLPVLIAESYHEPAVIAKLYRIVQSSADDRKKMIPTGSGRTSASSSKLGVQARRSLAVHTVSVDCAEPRGRDASTTVNVSDQTLPTPGRTHVCEVQRRSATKALADQCTQLELDALSHRKPMEVVSHGAGNVVELPLAGDQSRRCV